MRPPIRTSGIAAGFHGTSSDSADKILVEGFVKSDMPEDWLGTAAYFFQDAPQRAFDWARERHGNQAAVIRAEILVKDFIDLVDTGWSSWLAEVYDKYLEDLRNHGREVPTQKGGAHRLDREVLNYGVQLLESDGFVVRGIRGAFQEGHAVFPNSALFTLSHIQIGVRDLSLIREVRKIRAEDLQ